MVKCGYGLEYWLVEILSLLIGSGLLYLIWKLNDLRNIVQDDYYRNYLETKIKKELIEQIPKDIFYNATDFIEKLIDKKYKIITYSFSDYWLDIGSHSEFERAQKDIHNINFEI